VVALLIKAIIEGILVYFAGKGVSAAADDLVATSKFGQWFGPQFKTWVKGLKGKPALKVAEPGYQFNMIENAGPLAKLPGNPASNFASGKYNQITTTSELILYRGGKAGGGKDAFGRWFTRQSPESAVKVRIDSAVKPQWIDVKTGVLTGTSPIEVAYAIKFPAGTVIYEGPVATQGGVYVGGQNIMQIFIEAPWSIKGVQVLSETPIP